jgi:2-oxoglutarate/2-oxoacid ferredoxin oxidoreductase subunit beta
VLTAVQRLLAAEQLKPEQTVFVSGIGCSSRFPHYMKTYGFHGIHGRALPVATGVKLHRPELKVFVVMGDGDCTSIGAAHWLHATRYNMDMVALMLDNNIYGLTKNQTSPTTPQGHPSNTQPRGSWLPALDPIEATLGITNASFVAQTAEWIPQHLYATLQAAYRHRGFSLRAHPPALPGVHAHLYQIAVRSRRERVPGARRRRDGARAGEALQEPHPHDPRDMDAARRLAEDMSGSGWASSSGTRAAALRGPAPGPVHTVEEKRGLLERGAGPLCRLTISPPGARRPRLAPPASASAPRWWAAVEEVARLPGRAPPRLRRRVSARPPRAGRLRRRPHRRARFGSSSARRAAGRPSR